MLLVASLPFILCLLSVQAEESIDVLTEISSAVAEDLVKTLKNLSTEELKDIQNNTQLLQNSASNIVSHIKPMVQELVSNNQYNSKVTLSKLMDLIKKNSKVQELQRLSVNASPEEPTPRFLFSPITWVVNKVGNTISSLFSPRPNTSNVKQQPLLNVPSRQEETVDVHPLSQGPSTTPLGQQTTPQIEQPAKGRDDFFKV